MRRALPAIRLAALAAVLLALAAAWPHGRAAAAPSLAGSRAEVAALGREVAALDLRMGAAAAARNAALDRLDAARAEARATRRGLDITGRELGRLRGALADRLVSLYVAGSPSFVEVLLSSGGLAQAEEVGAALDGVARRDAATVAGLRARRDRLRRWSGAGPRPSARPSASWPPRRPAATSSPPCAPSGVACCARRARSCAAADEEHGLRERLAALARARDAALSALPVAGGPAPLPGALPAGDHLFPVAGPATFADDWLAPRAGGRSHEGIDLFADRGTPVVAVADGTLFKVGANGLGGWRLWLRDDAGTEFYYAHLDAYAAAAVEGARVSRGTVIGYVGDSGDARGTPTHLHFQIHPGGGGPVPPFPLVSAWPRPGPR
ncbi:M23 family metallopeptidase [Miltoncostaea marina]|uniref:M23 family metallopeptidase n=1 Tax=Miltoncostaea marina TaxID=2843215 RepID=UPI001C3E7232|nr:M23 family metallopeptidase [Miltoncostaea marina]